MVEATATSRLWTGRTAAWFGLWLGLFSIAVATVGSFMLGPAATIPMLAILATGPAVAVYGLRGLRALESPGATDQALAGSLVAVIVAAAALGLLLFFLSMRGA